MRVIVPTNRSYVYLLKTPEGVPFYVGKGRGARIFRHEREAQNHTCDCQKCTTIRQILAQGQRVCKVIVYTSVNDEDAKTEERRLIAAIGRDKLTNRTRGGNSPSDEPKTQTHKEKISASLHEYYKSDAAHVKLSAAMSGDKHPLYGKQHSEDTRQKMRTSAKARWAKQRVNAVV